MQKWHYHSENLGGNLHSAAQYISEQHPEWDVVAMSFNGGNYTVVVWREPLEQYEVRVRKEEKLNSVKCACGHTRGDHTMINGTYRRCTHNGINLPCHCIMFEKAPLKKAG